MNHANLSLFLALLLGLAPVAPAQWVRQNLPVDMGMALDVARSGDSSYVASGYILSGDFSGRAAYTNDGGTTWNLSSLPDSSRALVAVEFTSTDTGFIAAAYNKSTFSRASYVLPAGEWLSSSDGTLRKLRRIGFTGDPYTVGPYTEGVFTGGMLLMTTNRGQVWSVKHIFPDSVTYLLGGSFPTARTGFVAAALLPSSGEYAILKTTDGGSTWAALPIPDSITVLNDVCFTDSLRGYAAGRQFRNSMISGVVIRTTDGGATWDRTDFPAVTGLMDLEFPSATTGYAVGTKANSFIHKTTDGGTSWTPLSYQPDTIMLDGVCFAPGGVVGTAYGVRIRNDSLGSPLPLIPVAVTTTDGGASWAASFTDTSLTGCVVAGGIQIDPLRAYLSGGKLFSDGLMLHTENGGLTEVPAGNGEVLPGRFLLHQNYPNPFNGTTHLRYSLPAAARVSLKIFDVLGREASVLVEEWQDPGDREAAWRADDFPSGVYFCYFSANGRVQIRKLILMR